MQNYYLGKYVGCFGSTLYFYFNPLCCSKQGVGSDSYMTENVLADFDGIYLKDMLGMAPEITDEIILSMMQITIKIELFWSI